MHVNLLLIAVALGGVLAVIGGNALIQLNRRRIGPALAFTALPTPLAGDRTPRRPSSSTVADLSRTRGAPRRLPGIRRPSISTVLFAISFVFYAVVGGVLVLHYGSIVGDAESRVADGWYIFFSRDPHLAAVGFVWAPLPSLLVSPLFLFKSVWPVLTQRALAGNITSAAFMAGCVVQLRATLRELGTNRMVRWVLVVAFALNPMIVYYGANGMAEGIQLFFLIVAVRYLLRWLRSGRLASLAYSSVAVAFGYLTRYESLAAAGAGLAIVTLVAARRAEGSLKQRLQRASMDVIVFGIPPAAAFIGWAVVSYIITGHAFEYTASQYGNSSQLKVVGGPITAHSIGYPVPVFGGLQLLSFAPLLPIVFAGACYVCWKRRDDRGLALSVLVAVLGFTYLLLVSGSAFPWLRFYLPGVALSVLCIAFILTPPPTTKRAPTGGPRGRAIALALIAAMLALPGLATTALAMNDPQLGSGERENLAWVIWGHPFNSTQRGERHVVASVRAMAASLDARHLRSGSIVADTVTPCISMVLMTSGHPHQFVIPSDRDFHRILQDPPAFRAVYLLVPPTTAYGSLDAVNQAYPSLYNSGGHFARKVWEAHEPGCPAFRLYKVVSSPRLNQ